MSGLSREDITRDAEAENATLRGILQSFEDAVDLWLPKSVDAEHEGEAQALHGLRSRYLPYLASQRYTPEMAGSGQFGVCAHCGKGPTVEGHDGCLGTLPENVVMNACCGHGDDSQAYVQYWSGECVRGGHALEVIEAMKAAAHSAPEQAGAPAKRPQHEMAADEIVGIAYRLASRSGDEDAMTRIVELSRIITPDVRDASADESSCAPKESGDALAAYERILRTAWFADADGSLKVPESMKPDDDAVRRHLTASAGP